MPFIFRLAQWQSSSNACPKIGRLLVLITPWAVAGSYQRRPVMLFFKDLFFWPHFAFTVEIYSVERGDRGEVGVAQMGVGRIQTYPAAGLENKAYVTCECAALTTQPRRRKSWYLMLSCLTRVGLYRTIMHGENQTVILFTYRHSPSCHSIFLYFDVFL